MVMPEREVHQQQHAKSNGGDGDHQRGAQIPLHQGFHQQSKQPHRNGGEDDHPA
jgi:hypothetical protein